MTIVLLESTPDNASVGIAAALRSRAGWIQGRHQFHGHPVFENGERPGVVLARTDVHHIHAETIDEDLRTAGLAPTEIVFLSRHKSESGRPALTAHAVGNYRTAALGGRPHTLSPVRGDGITHMLRCLAEAKKQAGYQAEITFEVTHHGPFLTTPSFFAELGSSDPQWADPAGHAVLADAVDRFLTTPRPAYPTVIGLGGGHYGPRFTDAALTKQVHFAHLLPTYHAEAIDDPAPIVTQLKQACPGAVGVYYHDGTLKKEQRDGWLTEFAAQGLPKIESRSWPALPAFDTTTNNALRARQD